MSESEDLDAILNAVGDSSFRIFTVQHGSIADYAVVTKYSLKGADVTVPAIIIGEAGRGRKLGILPVQLLPESQRAWENSGEVKIRAAKITKTRTNRPKLIEMQVASSKQYAIVVFRTKHGFRGTCDHKGDRINDKHADFPGYVLLKGVIADGAAGNMAWCTQKIVIVPKDTVFSELRSGRLYGAPGAHYYIFDGTKIITATWEEREVTEVF